MSRCCHGLKGYLLDLEGCSSQKGTPHASSEQLDAFIPFFPYGLPLTVQEDQAAPREAVDAVADLVSRVS